MADESFDAYVAGKRAINIEGTLYEPGALLPNLGHATARTIASLLDEGRIKRVMVVTPAQLKRLQKKAGIV